jgi:pimeloyl-ACP methyl ester carboxylesterase
MIHGFPDFWYSWRHQMAALADRFQVVAIDQRGYNLSDKPKGVESYDAALLVGDVAAVVRHLGRDRATIVGHDWGGVIAWTFAGHYPELVDKLAILNAPHMKIYLRKVWRPPQIFRSWYVLLFQIPRVAEWALTAREFGAVRDMFVRMPARRGAFTPEDVNEYVAALSPPGALTAGLDYYRANLRSDGVELARSARISAETLVLWGDRDPALGTNLLDGLQKVAPRLTIRRFADVSHWIQNEAPEEVNRLLVEFLARRPIPAGAPGVRST